MVRLPPGFNAFEFVVLAALRAGQLIQGCTPRMDGTHKVTMMAQMEVAAGKVRRSDGSKALPDPPIVPGPSLSIP